MTGQLINKAASPLQSAAVPGDLAQVLLKYSDHDIRHWPDPRQQLERASSLHVLVSLLRCSIDGINVPRVLRPEKRIELRSQSTVWSLNLF